MLPTRDFAVVVDPHYLEDSLLTYPYGALTLVTDLAGLNPPINVHLDGCGWSAYPAYASPATSREPRYVREPTRR
jgi:hypothetical protein